MTNIEPQAIIHLPLLETASAATLVRPLGALERMLHRYSEEYPLRFSLVAELAGAVDPDQLHRALKAVQHRHPLLQVHIEDHVGSRLGFYQPAVIPPIPLTVFEEADGHTWQQLAATLFNSRFDPGVAPLLQAVLLRQGLAATIILSVDHTVADGMSTVFILEDIVAVLNGHQLAVLPVPPSQEQLLTDLPTGTTPPAMGPPVDAAPVDERLSTLVGLRPFDGATPDVTSITFGEDLTSRLMERCRAERTTVHGALVAATTQVMMSVGKREVVRVFTPFNFRKLLGNIRDSADYFTAARTDAVPEQAQDLWELARLTTGQLAAARSEAGTRAISAAIGQFIPVDADHTTAAGFIQQGLGCEALLSNLGVLDIADTGVIRPTAIWGPVMVGHFQDEAIIGIATLHGQLRMVSTSHAPIPNLLPLIHDTLAAAC